MNALHLRVERLEEPGLERALHRLLTGAQPLQSSFVALLDEQRQEKKIRSIDRSMFDLRQGKTISQLVVHMRVYCYREAIAPNSIGERLKNRRGALKVATMVSEPTRVRGALCQAVRRIQHTGGMSR